MENLKDIETLEDVQLLVDSFYSKIRENPMLKDIFNERIEERWPEHLEKMYKFWQTVLLEEHTYFGRPFIPHAQLPVEKEHFNEWLKIFYETVDSLFKGEKADRAKWQGERMAEMFHTKIQFFRNNSSIPLL